MANKNQAVPQRTSGETKAKESGYQVFHLLIAMVLGACFGAYFQLNFLSAAAPIAAQVTETI
jgi:hypothetical protein